MLGRQRASDRVSVLLFPLIIIPNRNR